MVQCVVHYLNVSVAVLCGLFYSVRRDVLRRLTMTIAQAGMEDRIFHSMLEPGVCN